MRVLVTGGAGFIGSHIVDALVARGDSVTVVDDLSRGRREQVNAAASFVHADITAPDLSSVFSSAQPEVVFHEAAQIDVRRSVREPLFDTTTNVVGTVSVLQAAVDCGARRVIFASSGGAIYGETDRLPASEAVPCAPTSHYGTAKYCGEIYGDLYSRMYGLDFVSMRYANVYGPRQDPHGEAGVIAIFALKMLSGEAPTINGDGLQTRDYVHVSDVVSANMAAIDGPPGAYNIGTGIETDVNEIYRLVAEASERGGAAVHGPAKAGEQLRSVLDCSLATRELAWKPSMSLNEGIAGTVAFFAERARVQTQ